MASNNGNPLVPGMARAAGMPNNEPLQIQVGRNGALTFIMFGRAVNYVELTREQAIDIGKTLIQTASLVGIGT